MSAPPKKATSLAQPAASRRFVFLLLDRFTMLAFASAIEPLRIANRMVGREVYRWKLAGEGGDVAVCSNGAAFKLDLGLDEIDRDDVLLVCGGMDVQKATTRGVLNWLRREARRGVTIGGLCTGAYAIAKAGLLDGKKATIHWENQDGFLEEFEEVKLTKSVFVMDGNRWTTAGGTSSLDLMLKVIAAETPKHAFLIVWPEDGSMPTYHSSTADTPIVVYRITEFLHKLYNGDFQ